MANNQEIYFQAKSLRNSHLFKGCGYFLGGKLSAVAGFGAGTYCLALWVGTSIAQGGN